MRRILVPIVAIAVVTLLIAGACGGGGKPDAAKIYKDAGKKMAALTAFHIEGNTEGGQNSGPFKGDFAAPDKFQFAVTGTDQNGQQVSFSQMQIGTKFYIQNPFFAATPPTKDWFVYAEELFGPTGDPVAFTNGLWTGLTGLTYVGQEDIGGVATYHVQATTSPELLGLIETDPKPTKDTTMDLWVGKKDSLIHRIKYTVAEASSTTTIDLSRFDDAAISIVEPASPLPATGIIKAFVNSASAETQDCLRGKWGEAAFEELKTGSRLPTKDEQQNGDRCGGGAAPAAETPTPTPGSR